MKKPIIIPFGVTVIFDRAFFLEILDRYGPQGWNRWISAINKQNLVYPSWDTRNSVPSFQIEFILKDIDLSNRELDGIDLTLVYVSKGDFSNSSLYGAKLLIADRCHFTECDLRTAFFNSCDISGANFTDAMIENVIWERAYYYKGNPPLGLPASITARLQQLEPDNAVVAETKKINCQASVEDAAYWIMAKD